MNKLIIFKILNNFPLSTFGVEFFLTVGGVAEKVYG